MQAIKTTDLAVAIVDESMAWVAKQCAETVANGGSCIDDVQEAYYGSVRREPYCTSFVWVVVNNACKKLGLTNILPKTAGALDLLNRSKKTALRVNTTPERGCVFYRRTTAQASGHTGIVIDLEPDGGMLTVEGNRSDRIDMFANPAGSIDPSDGWEFIHVQDMPGSQRVTVNPDGTVTPDGSDGFPLWAGVLLAGAAGYGIYTAVK